MSDTIADQECLMAKQALLHSYQNLLLQEQTSLNKAQANPKTPAQVITNIQGRVDKLTAIVNQLS